MKKTKTMKREIESAQLESVTLKEVPEDKKEEREEERKAGDSLQFEPPPEVSKEEKPKKKKKKAAKSSADAAPQEEEEQPHLRAEEKELVSPEVEESPLPLEVNNRKQLTEKFRPTTPRHWPE